MMTDQTRGSAINLLFWQWRNVLLFTIGGAFAVVLHDVVGLGWSLPTTPLTIVGAAIGIFVSFRTNSAYDRWWEGRKLWGRLINTSRHFATQAIMYIESDDEEADREASERIVRRHIAYVHALRLGLRKQDHFADPDFVTYMGDELDAMRGQSNINHALLHLQTRDMRDASRREALDEFRLQAMDLSVAKLLDIQGGCERIKGTPLPRGYAFIAETLIRYYSFLLPFVLVADLGWLTIPANILVCLSFALISEAGRVLEDPFNMFWNALPLAALSRKIEVNLLHALGEEDTPDMLQPDDKGILM